MYNSVYAYNSSHPYHHYGGANVCSSYSVAEPIPFAGMNACVAPHCHEHAHRGGIQYIDFTPRMHPPRQAVLPPISLTNVQNDISYYFDDSNTIYHDEYGYPYNLPRSKVQVVDVNPRIPIRSNPRRVLVATDPLIEPRERLIVPRTTFVRQASLPPYQRLRPPRLVPLYHSANPQYLISNRRPVAKTIVPLATTLNYYGPQRRTIKVRSLSP